MIKIGSFPSKSRYQEIRWKGGSLPLKSSGLERMYFFKLISFNQFNQFPWLQTKLHATHIEDICQKASRKLIWMCCYRSLNNEINWLHEECLRIVYNDKKLNFEELLKRDSSSNPICTQCFQWNGNYKISRTKSQGNFNCSW